MLAFAPLIDLPQRMMFNAAFGNIFHVAQRILRIF